MHKSHTFPDSAYYNMLKINLNIIVYYKNKFKGMGHAKKTFSSSILVWRTAHLAKILNTGRKQHIDGSFSQCKL